MTTNPNTEKIKKKDPYYGELVEVVENALERVCKERLSVPPYNLYEPVVYSLSTGGKRVRPVLCLMATDLFGGSRTDTINTALALEIFHNFTLIHDDIMDNSETRRGKDSVYKKDGLNTAILSGDAMTVLALEYIIKTDKNLSKTLNTFCKAAREVCEGQQKDMDFEKRTNVSEEEYIEMIRLKTAVLIAASLKLGAILADAEESEAEKLYQWGINLGVAFQIQDDLLDVYGNPKEFQKKSSKDDTIVSQDIIDDKKTYLLIKALDLADKKQREELDHWQRTDNGSLDDGGKEEKVEVVKRIYDQLGIRAITEHKIAHYFEEADKILTRMNIDPERKIKIKASVEKILIGRKS